MISRMNPSKVIGLVALAEKPGLGEALRIMRRELSRHGLGSCVIETPDALERAIGRCGMLVTFGGDGTMLTVSSLAAMHRVPLAGVNLGRLGFMTTCSVQELPLLAYALQEGSYLTDERSMLEVVRVGGDGVAAPPRKLALNEVSLIRAQSGKMVDLDAEIDGEPLPCGRRSGFHPHRLHGILPFRRGASGLAHVPCRMRHPHLPAQPDQSFRGAS